MHSRRPKFETEEERRESILRSKREYYYRNRDRYRNKDQQIINVGSGGLAPQIKQILLHIRDKIKLDPALNNIIPKDKYDSEYVDQQLKIIISHLQGKKDNLNTDGEDRNEILQLCLGISICLIIGNINDGEDSLPVKYKDEEDTLNQTVVSTSDIPRAKLVISSTSDI